jgi:hypothetical protein
MSAAARAIMGRRESHGIHQSLGIAVFDGKVLQARHVCIVLIFKTNPHSAEVMGPSVSEGHWKMGRVVLSADMADRVLLPPPLMRPAWLSGLSARWLPIKSQINTKMDPKTPKSENRESTE